jgi:uncharacterized membrane protein
MSALILGLIIFLGVHSVRIYGESWRTAQIARRGEGAWKALYSLASAVGLGLIVWGYGMARREPLMLWTPQPWARHLAALLMVVAFVLLAAAYVPKNGIRYRVHHPMILGVKVWALAHLLANHTLADALLFGSFLAWAVLDFRAARARDRVGQVSYAPGQLGATVSTVLVGVLAYLAFTLWLHAWLFGVRPF